MLRVFLLLSVIVPVGFAPYLRAESCDLGEKVRAFPATQDLKLLKELVEDPLFRRDEEKYAEALLRLKDIDKIKAFIALTNAGELSSSLRERRANALLRLLDYDPVKISTLLYVNLAQTQSARAIKPPPLTYEQWLQRIEVLSDSNDNARVISEVQSRKEPLSCRARFLLGKAFRKNRQYQQAIEVLDEVSQKCSGNDAVNAAFLLGRLAAIVASQANMKYFDRFQSKYPAHTYLDDILLFKASAEETLGRKEDAKRTLRQIWKLRAPADMRFEAIFRLAFMHALEGKSQDAIDILRKSLQENLSPEPTHIQTQRAKYWIARLSLFPEVGNLKEKHQDAAAEKMLTELASSLHPTYYSFMAAELTGSAQVKAAPRSSRSVGTVADSNFRTIFCMMEKGYLEEGKRFIELIQPTEIPVDQRLAVVHRLNQFGLYSDAFRFSRNIAEDDLSLMYPKAYEADVAEVAKSVGPPEHLLYGLMREESLFDARAISWAGAHGVFQLMPAVAREEGRKIKMTELTNEKMLDPKVNILLGARHLKGMLDEVKHPLFAVAAYNAGLDRVKKWAERWKSYEAIDSFVENIPLPETRDYVKRVAGAWVTYASLYASDKKPFGIKIGSHS